MPPITGKFEADFESFYSAVNKAQVELADFEKGTANATASLNRMVDQFSGEKIIQQATLAAEAVNRIGGVANLTKTELQQVAATAQQAVVKMNALGIEVPKNIQALAAELKPVGRELETIGAETEVAKTEMSGFGEAALGVAEEVAGMFAGLQVVEFIAHMGESERALIALSNQTQIDIGDLQDLTNTLKEVGIDGEELARALFHVQKGIADGDATVARGIHAIGLSVDEVKNLHGKELLLELEHGLANLNGSFRDTAAAELWGSRLGLSMGGVSTRIDEILAKSGNFQKVSKEQAEQLSGYADKVEGLGHNLKMLAETAIPGAIDALSKERQAVKDGAGWWALLTANVKDAWNAYMGHPSANVVALLAQDTKAAAAATGELAENTDKATHATDDEAQAAEYLFHLRQDAAKQLEPWQLRDLDQLRAMGALNAENAAHIHVSVDQLNQYNENIKRAEAATKELTKATADNAAQVEKVTREFDKYEKKLHATRDEQAQADLDERERQELDAAKKRHDAHVAQMKLDRTDTQENLAAEASDYEATTTKIRGMFKTMGQQIGVDFQEINKGNINQLTEDIRDAQKTLAEAEMTPGTTREEIEHLRDVLEAARQKLAQFQYATDAAGASQDKLKAKVVDLNAALMDQAKAAMTASYYTKGPSFSYDLSTATGLAQFLAMNPGARVSAPADYFKTHNLADAVLAGYVTGGGFSQFGAMMGGATGLTPASSAAAPGAPAIPAAGGTAPAAVVVNAPIHVSGVFDPASASKLGTTVSGALANTLTSARVLGAWR